MPDVKVMEYLEDAHFDEPFNRPLLVNHTKCSYTEPMPPSVPHEIYEVCTAPKNKMVIVFKVVFQYLIYLYI